MLKALIGMAVVLSVNTWAQSQTSRESHTAPAKTTEVTFDADTLEGASLQPDTEYVSARTTAAQPMLIRIRQEFKDKAMQSANEL